MSKPGLNPITLEVVRHSLAALLDELETNICRTAYSPLVYEVRDFCAGLLDAEGRLVSQGRMGIPIFVADLGEPVRSGLSLYGRDGFAPGDILITNDPEVCGQHLNNVVLFTPVFVASGLVGFVAVRMHWMDVGGAVPGSWGNEHTEIYQEGIQIRTVKLFKAGRLDEEILRLISPNLRLQRQVLGDMWSQVAACRMGEQRFRTLAERYTWPVVRDCIETIWDQSAEAARRRVREIPDGTYAAESFLDDDGVDRGRPVPVRVRVTVEGDTLTVDLSDVAGQVRGPINSGYAGGISAAKVAFKCLTTPETAANEGCFRPLRIVLPPGKFLSAHPPAAMSQWSLPLPTVIDTILRAIAQARPDWVSAAHHASFGAKSIVGRRPDTGELFICPDPVLGGWGASARADGAGPFKTMLHGDTYNIPVEVEETLFPVFVPGYGLRTDSGGPGRFRGGLGTVKRYRLPHPTRITLAFERSQCPPWGLAGGEPGMVGTVRVRIPGQEPALYQKAMGLPLPPGTELEVLSGGGGGHGHPWDRQPQRVREDVLAGYVSREAARERYGVALDPETLEVNEEETERLRRGLREGRKGREAS